MNDNATTSPTLSERIERYITDHPGCLTRELADGTNNLKNTAHVIAKRLRDQGKVTRFFIEGDKRPHWKPGREEGIHIVDCKPRGKYKTKEPGTKYEANRPVVKQWEPCTVRDPLVDLLFGCAGPTS